MKIRLLTISPKFVITETITTFNRTDNYSFFFFLFINSNTKHTSDKLTFDLSHRAQVLLKAIIKLGISDGLKVTGVNTAGGCGVAAFAHACVVAESTLVQVRVSQGILC